LTELIDFNTGREMTVVWLWGKWKYAYQYLNIILVAEIRWYIWRYKKVCSYVTTVAWGMRETVRPCKPSCFAVLQTRKKLKDTKLLELNYHAFTH
jgi:hypothetical protein